MLSKPVITAPIIGATKLHHIQDAVAALSIQLTDDELRRLEEGYRPHAVLGFS
jgi:aryl-alcohol dehydrogenase-like predicted oxidoreductase